MGLFIAIIIAVGLSLNVRRLIAHSTRDMTMPPPKGVEIDTWLGLTSAKSAGREVGLLDALISLAAFWTGGYVIVAGWLAFKVASKWQAWSTMIRVPESIEGIDDLEYLSAKNRWSSLVLTRFLLGTGVNVLIGVIAAAIGKSL